MVGNQGSCELLDVVGSLDLGEQVPFHRALVEGIQYDVAALRLVETPQVAAVGIRDDRAIAARQRGVKISWIAVLLPVPVVPMNLKCLVSSS